MTGDEKTRLHGGMQTRAPMTPGCDFAVGINQGEPVVDKVVDVGAHEISRHRPLFIRLREEIIHDGQDKHVADDFVRGCVA